MDRRQAARHHRRSTRPSGTPRGGAATVCEATGGARVPMRTAGGWLAHPGPGDRAGAVRHRRAAAGGLGVEHAGDDPQRLRELPRDVAAQRVAYAAVCHRLLAALRAADR